MLLETGELMIYEASTNRSWGIGGFLLDNSNIPTDINDNNNLALGLDNQLVGKNLLGTILMRVRNRLQGKENKERNPLVGSNEIPNQLVGANKTNPFVGEAESRTKTKQNPLEGKQTSGKKSEMVQ